RSSTLPVAPVALADVRLAVAAVPALAEACLAVAAVRAVPLRLVLLVAPRPAGGPRRPWGPFRPFGCDHRALPAEPGLERSSPDGYEVGLASGPSSSGSEAAWSVSDGGCQRATSCRAALASSSRPTGAVTGA